ncbi:MAG TPA: RHS repeat-associated core domain-containing protein [Pyrinomonadaceae bacterium]
MFGSSFHDSVDGDDGVIDGLGRNGDSYFSGSGAAGITFTFNAAALGSLPTHAGLVWTDGLGTVTFEAFDHQGVSMGVRGPFNFPDASNNGTTGEDRFLGAFNRGGISAIRVTNSVGGIEIDHLQYAAERSANTPPTVNAGDDQLISLPVNSVTLDGSALDDGVPACGALAFAWSKVSGPGTVTFANANAATTSATFGTPGTYVLRLTVSDSELVGTDEVTVRFSAANQAPQVNAGPDQTVALGQTASLSGSFVDDGLPVGATVSTTWSMASGPGLVTFADPTSLTTTAIFSEAGIYVLRLSANDTALTGSDEMIVMVTPPNGAPTVNAGTDQTITLPGTARLNGTATDDGLPHGSALTTTWTKVSGPGDVAFADAASVVTTATFGEAGTYVLRLSASDTELTSTDDVTVTVNPVAPNAAPVVNAGADQTVELNSNHVRNGGNDEQLVNGEIRAWTKAVGNLWTRGTSGAGGLPESVNGDAFFHAGETASAELRQDVDVTAFASTINAGTQSFEWKAFVRSRAESVPDTARVIVEYRNAANTLLIARLDSGEVASTSAWHLLEDTRPAPAGTGWIRIRLIATRRTGTTNDAYFDALSLRAVMDAGVKLAGTVTDDGLPVGGALSTTWTKVSGPGSVAFADASAATTSATFGEAGTYVLRLSASDSELTSGDELTVTVEPRNLAPVVEAGADQTVTLPATASLSGLVTDDGKPTGAAVTSNWTKVSGPGTVTFADANAPVTTATFSVEGTYVLRLSANDTEHGASDTLTVTVNPEPPNLAPTVNAGADQLVNPPETTATLSGTVTDDGKPTGGSLTYAWTKVSGPGNVAFGSPAALVTTATFGEAGVYVLRLAANDTELTGSDDVRVTVNGTNKAPTVNAGADQTVAFPTTVTLTGTATDDGLPLDSTLSFAWTKLSGPGDVTFASASALQTTATFSAAGAYVLRLAASDTALSATDDVTVTQTSPPTAGISSPADGAAITGRTNFLGTVGEGSEWRLEYSLNEDAGVPVTWTALASGATPVTNGVLGTFDPTVLLNGLYTVRLVATNGAGQTTTSTVRSVVEGEQKVGNFTLAFNDLNVPVAGMPIEVTRTYDSRDKRTGDFGVGWRLALSNVRVQETGPAGANWQGTVSGGFFPSYCVQPSAPHTVTVTMPGGKVYKFEATLGPQCSTLLPLRETTISYRALTGTNATLAPVGDPTVFVNAAFPGGAELLDYGTLDPKDFDEYRLTLPGGEVYLLSQQAGLRKMTDANGNTLTIGPNGVTHSSGKSVAFTRDAQGRITQITDPSGAAMSYSYDARGDLVGFRDRENNVSTYTYNSSHGLLTITDPRGVQPVRNEYDDTGRLVKNIDAFGKTVVYQHDDTGRRETITDRLGRVTVIEYNQRGNVVRTTDPEGRVRTSTYDSQGNRMSDTDPTGRVTSYTYDAQNNRTSITDPLGNTTRFTYNVRKLPLTITDPMGRVTTHTYDANGNLLTTKDALGNTTSSTYSVAGQLQTATDAQGNITRYDYDATGRVVKETNAQSVVTTFTYDANGNRKTQTETRTVPASAAFAAPSSVPASGFAEAETAAASASAAGEAVSSSSAMVTETLTTTMEYDKLDRLIKVTYPDGSTVRTEYDSAGRKSADIDQLGRRTSYEYDAMGNLVRVTYPDGSKTEATYDADGRRVKTVDRAGLATTYTYDAGGRVEKITYADGKSITAVYDALGRVTATIDARGNRTNYEYDPACGCSNRVTKVTDALGHATTFTYDANGNRITMTDAVGHTTTYEYDSLNRGTRAVFHDGSSSAVGYDTLGRRVSKTDQAGKTTRFEYDSANRLVKVIDALNQATRFTYDELGNLISQTDANNHTTAFEYDSMNRRVKRTLPMGMSETYAYDLAGQLTNHTDFKGKTTTYDYDVMGRLVSKTPDPSLAQPSVTYTYNQAGLRASMTDASGVTAYAYDARYRLTGKQTPQGALTYTYDSAGNLLTTRSSNANGLSVDFAYDVLNRLASVTDNRTGATQTVYQYDSVGNLGSLTYGNGVVTTYAYDNLNRLTGVTSAKGSTLAGYTYTLGAAGNRLSVTEHGGRQVSYTYDDLYRLTGETVAGDPHSVNGAVGYTFDPVGNRKTQTSTLPGVATATYDYDANDRLVADTSDANGNTTGAAGNTYSFDFENRLTEMNGGAVRVVHDGDGNRVSKTAGGVTVRYLIDDNNHTGYAQVAEELVGGQVQRQYTYGHDLISQNQLIGGEWKQSFYGYDGHGSVRYLTDPAGAVTDTYDYDSFGNILRRTGSTPNDYLYAGEQYDAHLGLQYLRARYMNHATGRFWTQDTYEGDGFDPVTLHKYLYANADPVNHIDPTGNFSLGDISVSSAIHSTLSGMSGLVARAIIWWVKRALYGALAGAAMGAVYGGIDAALGDGEILAGVIDGAKGGAVVGAIFGPLMAIKGAIPILTALGIGLSIPGAIESWQNGYYAQAVFRVAAPLLPWAIGKLRQLIGPLKLSRNGNGVTLTGDPDGPGGSGGGGGGSGGGGTGGGGGGGGGGRGGLPDWAQSGLDDVARFRSGLGPVPGGGRPDGGVIARLDVGGQSFYGMNAHGQPVTMRVNNISRTHAELDAFQQAYNSGVRGGTGTLYVDAPLCGACGRSGAVRSLARQLGLQRLVIVTPGGVVTIIP